MRRAGRAAAACGPGTRGERDTARLRRAPGAAAARHRCEGPQDAVGSGTWPARATGRSQMRDAARGPRRVHQGGSINTMRGEKLPSCQATHWRCLQRVIHTRPDFWRQYSINVKPWQCERARDGARKHGTGTGNQRFGAASPLPGAILAHVPGRCSVLDEREDRVRGKLLTAAEEGQLDHKGQLGHGAPGALDQLARGGDRPPGG